MAAGFGRWLEKRVRRDVGEHVVADQRHASVAVLEGEQEFTGCVAGDRVDRELDIVDGDAVARIEFAVDVDARGVGQERLGRFVTVAAVSRAIPHCSKKSTK